MGKKVLVGMSGGVDSAVAASILMDQGYEVVGATLNLWDGRKEQDEGRGKSCCSLEDVEDARSVAFKLGIPFYVLNMKELFQQKVVDYFIDSYLKGDTPNPCIACNRHIKFQAMLEKAEALGIDYIATGHYARNEFDNQTGIYTLKKGKDRNKDQSYVLYMLNQEHLKKLLLPLGGLEKSQIRQIAKEKEFRVWGKPDSQDICFVQGGKYGDFIRSHSDAKMDSGFFVDGDGKPLGEHKGIIDYTIGQRRGLGIPAKEPLYVIEKNLETNQIVLGSKSQSHTKGLMVTDMNYVSFDQPTTKFKAKVKVRYSANEVEALVIPLDDNKARIEFATPSPFVASGQAVVLYDDELVLGGGVIEACFK